MKRNLPPSWSRAETRRGERMQQAWSEYATSLNGARPPFTAGSAATDAAAVRVRHEAELLAYPNVVAVADGVRMVDGEVTGEPCIVVYVSEKVPRTRLEASELSPDEIEGVVVDVVAVGEVSAHTQ